MRDTVTYMGLMLGDAPKMVFVERLTVNNRERVFSEAVPILAEELLHRLKAELTVADEIELSVDYDYSRSGFSSHVCDFRVATRRPQPVTAI